ncbi:MAG TPA: hypothetical protein VMT23_00300 [Candidatus Binatia bacterium]|nr:hypothetical protein [Candidatus Binatia bacterium]
MYEHGKPIHKSNYRLLAIIIGVVLVVLFGGFYLFVIRGNHDAVTRGDKTPLVSTVKTNATNTNVQETDFELSLPGKWKLAAQNWDNRYQAWQWQFQDKRYAGRWFEVYQDTIPADYAYNYMLPVSANGDSVTIGSVSGNCANFTTTNQTKINGSGTVAAPSKWQGISFYCDYGRQSLQVVGTSGPDGINTLTLKGDKSGTHKYFFLYEDNDIDPDLGIIGEILTTFHAK